MSDLYRTSFSIEDLQSLLIAAYQCDEHYDARVLTMLASNMLHAVANDERWSIADEDGERS